MRLIYALTIVCLGLVACSGSNNDESPEVDKYNLDAEPTDGGDLTEDTGCEDKARSTKWCVRDGDESFLICRSTTKIEKVECGQAGGARTSPFTYCYGARDSEEPECITEERLLETTESIEPGSDLWLDKRRERGDLPPEERSEYAVTIVETSLTTNEDGDVELSWTIVNNADSELLGANFKLTPRDGNGNPTEEPRTSRNAVFLQPAKRVMLSEVFLAPTSIKSVEIALDSATIEKENPPSCRPDVHRQCSWTATLE